MPQFICLTLQHIQPLRMVICTDEAATMSILSEMGFVVAAWSSGLPISDR